MTSRGPWGTREPPRGGSSGWIWLVVALAVAGIVALLAGSDWVLEAEHVHRILVAVVVGGAAVVVVARRLRGRFSQGLFFAALWGGIALALALGYAYRGALRDVRDRLALEFMPGAVDWRPGVVRVAADRSGHYVVEANVNGTPVRFLVDTGASSVVLTARDAARVGFRLNELQFNRRAETAAGPVQVAPIRLERVAIGDIELLDVAAQVNRASDGPSLLGMSFLARLTGFSVEEGHLVLRR
jgi:aspartyl protease family protein